MTTRLRALLLSSLVALAAAGCAPASSTSPSATLQPSGSVAASVSAHSIYPLTLTDDAGREITLPSAPIRIVSLAPSNTEIVCALAACDELVGVTDFDDFPAQVTAVTHVVVGAVVDVEKVVAARPQLILAAGNGLTPGTVIDQLTQLGYPVLSLYPRDLDGVYHDISLVGAAIDAPPLADTLLTSLKVRADAVATAVAGASRPRTFYEVGVFEGAIYTAGKDSFLSSLVSLAGGAPITGDAAYDPSITAATVTARPGWSDMAAVHGGRIVVMVRDVVITRPGPRIVDGLEALARAIHPELFP